ncbi:bifunctional 5,10-methylenetetrahydrofolate dehydrogenase/5,10-methenyltetrahydrofolate cyclohydrolase [Candidatus Parcubacteria bacterium]|jgi:methylenetetrahydrofolate dehydrogenase (NADP+)/methenyltetrahydrofolate cyclohydrolase|nr:MAG: bifunctional 5,10-methylenetetrahydrofolate dehydrogenase/5,10-methenyltetrahydrofolate cyclohydrolase [Candidatus Parcubacteria bacterium]
MQLLDSRKLALQIRQDLKQKIAGFKIKPGLAIILVGKDQASHTYVRLKAQAAQEIGMHFERFVFPENTSQADIINRIRALNQNPQIHGVLVQLPLPRPLSADQIISAIGPKKDADGFQFESLKNFRSDPNVLAPALCQGVWRLIQSADQNLNLAKAAILANSTAFGEPMSIMLARQGLDVIPLYPPFQNFQTLTKAAKVVVIAIGQANFLKAEHLAPGVIVIDVGFNRVDGKVVGDVDSASVKNLPGWLTPVPGGVGPMTVAMLMQRVLALYEKNAKL